MQDNKETKPGTGRQQREEITRKKVKKREREEYKRVEMMSQECQVLLISSRKRMSEAKLRTFT